MRWPHSTEVSRRDSKVAVLARADPVVGDRARSVRGLLAALQRGETDLLDGGVASARIAEELEASHSAARSALQRLEQRGVVTARDGAAPESLRARRSFVPTALLEGGESA